MYIVHGDYEATNTTGVPQLLSFSGTPYGRHAPVSREEVTLQISMKDAPLSSFIWKPNPEGNSWISLTYKEMKSLIHWPNSCFKAWLTSSKTCWMWGTWTPCREYDAISISTSHHEIFRRWSNARERIVLCDQQKQGKPTRTTSNSMKQVYSIFTRPRRQPQHQAANHPVTNKRTLLMGIPWPGKSKS